MCSLPRASKISCLLLLCNFLPLREQWKKNGPRVLSDSKNRREWFPQLHCSVCISWDIGLKKLFASKKLSLLPKLLDPKTERQGKESASKPHDIQEPCPRFWHPGPWDYKFWSFWKCCPMGNRWKEYFLWTTKRFNNLSTLFQASKVKVRQEFLALTESVYTSLYSL